MHESKCVRQEPYTVQSGRTHVDLAAHTHVPTRGCVFLQRWRADACAFAAYVAEPGVGRGACGTVVDCVAFAVPATLGNLLRAKRVALVVATSLASWLVRRQGWRRFTRATFSAEFASLRRAAAWKFQRYLCRAARVAGDVI